MQSDKKQKKATKVQTKTTLQSGSRHGWWGLLLVSLVAVSWGSWSSPAKGQDVKEPERYVFLLSIDGLSHKHLLDKRLPFTHLRRLAKEGILAGSRTIFPSMTWPSHASLVTGQYPREHGILGNRWLHNKKQIYWPYWEAADVHRRSESIYDLATQRGIRTAALMWPATQGSKTITYNLPEVARRRLFKRYVDSRMLRAAREAGYSREQLFQAMAAEDIRSDRMVTKLAISLVQKKQGRPGLFLMHYLDLDHVLHGHGTSPSRALKRSARELDALFGQIVEATKKAGIYKRSTFFVVSDHGFLQSKKTIDLRQVLMQAGVSRYQMLNSYRVKREDVSSFYNGHAGFIYIHPRKGDKAKRRVELRRKILASLRKIKEIERVYTPKEYAALGFPSPKEDRGAPDLIALAKPDCYFRLNPKGRLVRNFRVGMHGYLPGHKDIQVPFLAFGETIRERSEPLQVRNIDVAPTVARILGLSWSQPRAGRVLSQILDPTALGRKARLASKKR
ncbi:MAG: alkaline phosphatase family protein [Myxococcales bacterium]|nr:alkaline phosphatase family protein [Myxococcales bacterium]MCB9642367.1 alkaline phosphatase family protein [Myxococcales bacterium]